MNRVKDRYFAHPKGEPAKERQMLEDRLKKRNVTRYSELGKCFRQENGKLKYESKISSQSNIG